jgi:PRTRC genetic system protein E
MCENKPKRREGKVFVELMPLLKERTLLITVARIKEKLKVNVIPTKVKEGEKQAVTTPLSYTGSPEELDAQLGKHLASYVDSHVQLGSTLAEAKAEMEAAAKAARQRAKPSQQAKTPDETGPKTEPTTSTAPAAVTIPSLFEPQQPTVETVPPDRAEDCAEEGSNETR